MTPRGTDWGLALLVALGLVLAVLVSGLVWSTFDQVGVAGYTVLLLATHVGAEPPTHSHGAPCRLVAPGR